MALRFDSLDDLPPHLRDQIKPDRSSSGVGNKPAISPAPRVDVGAALLNMLPDSIAGAAVREYRGIPGRMFRFDLAWVNKMIAVEIEGGIWMETKTGRSKGHAHPVRFLSDIEKYNLAACHGWSVYRFTPGQVRDLSAVAFLVELWRDRGW